MIRPKGLGRGLDALLSGSSEESSAESQQTIAIDRLRPGKYQPRTRMDEASLDELAASIREQGIMQPILVRPVEGARFEIIAGERRWRAAQRAGLTEVPALVKAVPDQAALALALIENIQREDLNAARGGAGPRAPDRRIRPHPRGGGQGGRPLAQRGHPTCCGCASSPSRCRSTCSPASSTWGMRARCSGSPPGSRPARRRASWRRGCRCAKPSASSTTCSTRGASKTARAARTADPDLARLQEELAEIARRHGGDRTARAPAAAGW